MFGMSMKNVGQQIDAPVAVSNIRGVDSVVSLSKPESVATENLDAGVVLHKQNFRRQLVRGPTGTTCEIM